MNVKRHGIILNTERYQECVAFYQSVFDLKIMFQLDEAHSVLTCFEFGGAYLMIEEEGVATTGTKTMAQNPTKLRFNIDDIDAAIGRLESLNIPAEVIRAEWGTTINIIDPDGNRVGIRDEASFKAQIQ